MKKILIVSLIAGLVLTGNVSFAINYYEAPNAGNMNFRTLMMHQMEQNETLDFINDPEGYKEKREKKDAQLDYEEGKSNFNPSYKPTTYHLQSTQSQTAPDTSSMQFTKDENGNIKIQGIK